MVDILGPLTGASTRQRIDAALNQVRALREHLATVGSLDKSARESLRLEIAALSEWMSRDLPRLRASRESPWPFLKAADQRLDGETAGTPAEIDQVLAAFERLLEMQRHARHGSVAPSATQDTIPVSRPAPKSAEPPEASTLTPSESALLASLTEKFYGSWVFRSLGLAITAAVGIALCGDLVIGVKTISLSDSLKNAAESGQKSIEQQSEATRKTFENLNQDAARQSQRLTDQVAAAKNDWEVFKGSFETIRKDVSDRAIGWVSSALTSRAAELSQPMEAKAAALSADVDAIRTQKLEPLETQVSAFVTEIDTSRRTLGDPGLKDALKHVEEARVTIADLPHLQDELARVAQGAAVADRLLAEAEKLKPVEAAADSLALREAVVATRLTAFEKAVTDVPPAGAFEGMAGAIQTVRDEASKAVARSGTTEGAAQAAAVKLREVQKSADDAAAAARVAKDGGATVAGTVKDLADSAASRQRMLGQFDGDAQRLAERMRGLNDRLEKLEAILPLPVPAEGGNRLARAIAVVDAAATAAADHEKAALGAAAGATTAMGSARASADSTAGYARTAGDAVAGLSRTLAGQAEALGRLERDVTDAEARKETVGKKLDALAAFLSAAPSGEMAQKLAEIGTSAAVARELAEKASASSTDAMTRLAILDGDLKAVKERLATPTPDQPRQTKAKPAPKRRATPGRRHRRRRRAA